MVLSSTQLQKVSVTQWFRRLQCLIKRSVLSVFIDLRTAECVFSLWTSCLVINKKIKLKYHTFFQMHITALFKWMRFPCRKLAYSHYICEFSEDNAAWMISSTWATKNSGNSCFFNNRKKNFSKSEFLWRCSYRLFDLQYWPASSPCYG